MPLDIALFYFFNYLPHTSVLDTIATWIHYTTRYGLIYYPFLVALLFSKHKPKVVLGKLLAVSAAGTYILTDIVIKNIVQRPRPFQALIDVIYLPPAPSSYSFPSGQAAVAFALATTIWLRYPKSIYSYTSYVLATLIAIDRMYMGHHYFSDVFVGGLIGTLIACMVNYYFTHRKKTSA